MQAVGFSFKLNGRHGMPGFVDGGERGYKFGTGPGRTHHHLVPLPHQVCHIPGWNRPVPYPVLVSYLDTIFRAFSVGGTVISDLLAPRFVLPASASNVRPQ